ncbi:MAG: flavodoxin family protein [Spirochaetes bacterium]|nr:flavodoxin family protein [Spirochaetota bacterium]
MIEQTKFLTLLGSPHKANSNTKALVDDFVEDISNAGLNLVHQYIFLGEKKVNPCIGCWSCTRGKPCPLKDDLEEIKEAMLDCDVLIVATPVYTNQITAQLKALFDRLFTWCHIFPLLGKYSFSVCTTGNDGLKPTSDFVQKMLATYGTFSLGRIESIGGFTSGFFPFRQKTRKKYRKLAQKTARIINRKEQVSISPLQKKMYQTMYRKMSGANIFRYLADTADKSTITPSAFRIKLVNKILVKNSITRKEVQTIANMMSFEYNWWRDRNWLTARSFKQLLQIPIPPDFDVKKRLLEHG